MNHSSSSVNVLILGSGGREHAIAWKLAQSPLLGNLYIAPGNGGTMLHGSNVNISPDDFKNIGMFAVDQKVDMVVVGPEIPLVSGIYDYFQSKPELSRMALIGPSKAGAMLEGSKRFANEFMIRHSIPTAGYKSFTLRTLKDGFQYLQSLVPPYVLKADGLAAGKGVLILDDLDDAEKELKKMLKGSFGEASKTVVIEEFLEGIEVSVFALTDGESYLVLPEAKDYKRIGEGNTGLNTGGMGAISPVPFADKKFMDKVEKKVIIPTIEGLRKEKITYIGFIYFGLMNMKGEPYVIEYNVRLGDPETQVVLPRVKNDLLALLLAASQKQLAGKSIEIDSRYACTIVLASGGYPDYYERGKKIEHMEKVKNSLVFHAGTRKDGVKYFTNGGRVLNICSYGNSLKEAVQCSNQNADIIQFEKKYYRRDIGFDLK
jgi:phosphoribosylamine--glycine ligase